MRISHHAQEREPDHRPHHGDNEPARYMPARLRLPQRWSWRPSRHLLRGAWRAWGVRLDTAGSHARRSSTIMNDIHIHDFAELLYAIRSQPFGALWRHNIAGDLPSNNRVTIDASALQSIVAAAPRQARFHLHPRRLRAHQFCQSSGDRRCKQKRLHDKPLRKFTRACR